MDCCNNLTPDFSGESEAIDLSKVIGRRTALKRLASLAGGIMFISDRHAYGQGRQVLLAFCGQLLCVVPYEVARARGHFAEEGLDVRLVYTRGGNVAMQALVGNAVDYAGTSFDVALQAYAHGAKLYEPLRLAQVDAGMVQEPALTLITGAGGGVIANIMDIEEANRYLGGPYEFMGVAVRVEEREKRWDQMGRLARALAKGLRDTRTIPVKEAVAALPKELITDS